MAATHLNPADSGDKPPAKRPRLRRFQFRLRTLLLAIGVCALGAFAWRTLSDALPYREQRRTMALVEKLGGSYQTAEASSWHRRLFGRDLQNLVLVNLADCGVPEEYIEAVANLPQLETLAVGGETFTDQHLDHLRRTLPLRYLVLDSTSVSNEAIAALRAAQPKLEIHFSERRAMAALRGIGMIHEVPAEVPELLRERLGDAYFHTCKLLCCASHVNDAHLARMKHLRNLETLRVYQSGVSDAGLANLQGLSKLRVLNLGKTKISDAGVAHLAGLTNLRELRLFKTQITDGALAHLKGLSQLEELELTDAPISDAGLAQLKGLTRLKFLDLSGTRCTKTAVQELRQALPTCGIDLDPNAAE